MAYLITMAVDNAPFEKGDITSWRPEGATNFGEEVLRNPLFRIIHCADMSDAQADAMCVQQSGDRKLNPNLKLRAFNIAFTLLPSKNQQDINGGVKFIIVTLSDFTPARITKPIPSAAIGSSSVIG